MRRIMVFVFLGNFSGTAGVVKFENNNVNLFFEDFF